MHKNKFNKRIFTIVTVAAAIAAFIAFLVETGFTGSPFVLFLLTLFLIMPYREKSIAARRIIFVIVVFFIFWMISFLPETFAAFVFSFIIAYLFDPLVSKLTAAKRSRWLISSIVIILLFAVVAIIAIFIFPLIFSQINDVLAKVSSIVSTATDYLEKNKVQQLLASFGIEDKHLQQVIKNEFVPELKSFLQGLFNTLLVLISGISGVAKQMLNAILIPIISFYFLKDFDKIKNQLKIVLGRKDKKMLSDLRRINDIFRVYIGWQVFAASMIAVITSVVFTLAGVSNGILLGILCGFLNPIPYIGLITSWVLSSLIILVIAPDDMWYQIIVIILTVNVIHFLNAYFIEPNVLGSRIGVHPLLLIASLFIFGALFGFLGLLIAVPCTATLMLFYEDWKRKLQEEVVQT